MVDVRVAELRSKVMKAKQAYYFGDSPIMSDEEYDVLEEELCEVSPDGQDDVVLAMVGCPCPPDSILEDATHSIAMNSQDKVNTVDELKKWYEKRAKGETLHVSLKGDGGSAAAYYEDGFLVQAISRGDGEVGQNITATVAKFKGLPSYLSGPDGPFSGSIRFEAILTKKDWATVGGKNPRNQGNGIMCRKSGEEAEYITAYAFDVEDDMDFASETEKSGFLMNMGVTTMPFWICESIEEVIDVYDSVMKDRGPSNSGKLDFWIDGIVIKVDSLAKQKELGFAPSGKYHKGQVAWKPDEEGATTILRDVVMTGGHDGGIYPNARFDPVEIGGTIVSNALLNNWDLIGELDVAVGDTIYVVKANDIIPKVRRVIARPKNRKPIPEPTSCPFCGGPVARKQTLKGDGAQTMCLNVSCPAKQDLLLRTWFKKTDTQGVGDAVRKALQDQLGIFTPADIYKMGTKIPVESMREIIIGDKMRFGSDADNLVAEINKKRNLPLHIFLGSLGIEGLGRREVELACDKAPELSTLADWRSGKLKDKELAVRINAPNKASKWVDGIDFISDVIDDMLAEGVTVMNHVSAPKPAVGTQTACITGALPSGKKKAEYRDEMAAAGIVLVDKVSKDLTFLVVSDPSKNTTKTQKVEKYNAKGSNIRVISEGELVTIIS